MNVNFGDEQERLLKLLLDEHSPENFASYVEAAGRGIAVAFAFVKDQREMEFGLKLLSQAILAQAVSVRSLVHEESMDADAFLRDHFNPGEFNG